MGLHDSSRGTAVFCLNWNREDITRRLLRSLAEHCREYCIYVFDNGSDSLPADGFTSDCATVRLVPIAPAGVDLGFAGGVNRAIAFLNANGFAFAYEINNDCVVRSDPVRPCIEAMNSFDKAVLVESKQVSPGKAEEDGEKGRQPSSTPVEASSVLGCAMLIHCARFIELGGLDERFFCYHEETEFCMRAAKAGMTLVSCPASWVLHYHKGSDFSGNHIYYSTRNWFLLKRKHPRSVFLTYLLCIGLPSALGRGGTGCMSYAQGLIDGLSGHFGRRGTANGTAVLVLVFAVSLIAFSPR